MKSLKINKLFTLVAFFICMHLIAQVGINTPNPDPSSILDIQANNKGLLLNKVALTSRLDITTIPNPARGLVVISSNDAGTGVTKVFKDLLYFFNGTSWEELLQNNTNKINFLFPKAAAMGRKTVETSCTGLNSNTFELDPTTFIQKDGNVIFPNGAIKASKKGYYNWSVKLTQKMRLNSFDPYFTPGLITYNFKSGTDTTNYFDQYFTYSGTVYLDINETSDPFTWHLGDANQVCVAENKIGDQVVLWTYLGE